MRLHVCAGACLLILAAAALPAQAHPFHVSLAEVEYNAARCRLEVALRVHPGDLEQVLRRGSQPLDLEHSTGIDDQILPYLRRTFQVRADGGPQCPLRWVGKEVTLKDAWLYFEVLLPADARQLACSNRLLFDRQADQVNTMQVRAGQRRQSIVCTRDQDTGSVLLQQPASLDVPATTHPPQRPLPQARPGQLTAGPAYYVDPSRGDDAGNGSLARPWRSLQHAVRQLNAGDTLYMRGGVYYEKVALTRSGTAEAPIVIAAYPGELPVLDGGLREFLESPASSWEPAPDGAEDEYVSTRSYPAADSRRAPYQFLPASWEPMWGLEDQRPLALGHFADSMVPLHGYRTLEDLRSSNELQPKNKQAGIDTVYCGPGLWFNRETSRIHVRLAHHQLAGLGPRAYRGETDPRKLPLVVAVGFGDDVLRISGIQHVRLEGLVLRGATGSPMIHIYGSHHIQLDHLTVYGGFPGLLINASQQIGVTHSAFRGLAAPWSGRAHMKYRGTASYQIVLQNGQPVNEEIELAHCEFTDDHDFAFLRFARNLRFHHNFVDNFNDDGLECGAKLRWHTIHVHDNWIGACLGVFQQHEIDKDESPATHDPDSGVYVYRNVFDQRAGVYYGLPAEPDPSGAFLHHEGHLISDHGSPTYPVMRVYHNTFLRREPVFRDYFLFGLGAVSLRDTERDVFNNLFVQADRVPGTVILGKLAGPLREGGNLLWGVNQGPLLPGDPFARLRGSPLFEDSRKYYAPGWTTNDRVADPRLVNLASDWTQPSDLRLAPGSPAIDAGQAIPEAWPDSQRELDQGPPDIGALPLGAALPRVGIDGRLP
ncbi:MAG: hypothetical protein J5I93_23860 [Pirellulaceae bacterium]|nr:hypothetical protein [Pirellulaceae bacterium]